MGCGNTLMLKLDFPDFFILMIHSHHQEVFVCVKPAPSDWWNYFVPARTQHTPVLTQTQILCTNTQIQWKGNQLTNHEDHWGLTPLCSSETFEYKKVQKQTPTPQKNSCLDRTWPKYIKNNLDLDSKFCQDFGKPPEKVEGDITSQQTDFFLNYCSEKKVLIATSAYAPFNERAFHGEIGLLKEIYHQRWK